MSNDGTGKTMTMIEAGTAATESHPFKAAAKALESLQSLCLV